MKKIIISFKELEEKELIVSIQKIPVDLLWMITEKDSNDKKVTHAAYTNKKRYVVHGFKDVLDQIDGLQTITLFKNIFKIGKKKYDRQQKLF